MYVGLSVCCVCALSARCSSLLWTRRRVRCVNYYTLNRICIRTYYYLYYSLKSMEYITRIDEAYWTHPAHSFLFSSFSSHTHDLPYASGESEREILYCHLFGFLYWIRAADVRPYQSTDFPIQFRYPTFYFLINRAFNDLNYWVLSRLNIIIYMHCHTFLLECEHVCLCVFLHFIYGSNWRC